MANPSEAPIMRSIEEGGPRRGSSYGTASDDVYGGIFGADVAGASDHKEAGQGQNKRRNGGIAGLTSSTSLPVVLALGVLIFVVGAAVGVLVGGTHTHDAAARVSVPVLSCPRFAARIFVPAPLVMNHEHFAGSPIPRTPFVTLPRLLLFGVRRSFFSLLFLSIVVTSSDNLPCSSVVLWCTVLPRPFIFTVLGAMRL